MFNFSAHIDNIACVTPLGEKLTYGELEQRSYELSQHIRLGSLSFILCSNTISSLVGYVATTKLHGACLLLSAETPLDSLLNLIETYQPQQIWLPSEYCTRYQFELYTRISSDNEYSLLQNNNYIYTALPKELKVLLTTSGSTGSPKLVRLSETNIMHNAESICEYLQIDSSERPITSLPMHYSYGLSVINSHLVAGATLLLTNASYVEKTFWEFAANEKATSFAGVPYTYEILKKLKFFHRDLPYLKTLTQAGGKLSKELIEYFVTNSIAHSKRFIVMYGQTEATARMSYVPEYASTHKVGSIGIPIPNGTFKIFQDGIEVIDSNQSGELVYYGTNVSLGYAECLDDLYLGDVNNGILYTGDVAYKDDDGFFYIVGRLKRFLKLFGNRISLDYTESLLKGKYNGDYVCVGTDNKMIIYTDNLQPNYSDVIKYICEFTHIQHSAFEIRHIERIPRSASGKILYHQLLNE